MNVSWFTQFLKKTIIEYTMSNQMHDNFILFSQKIALEKAW